MEKELKQKNPIIVIDKNLHNKLKVLKKKVRNETGISLTYSYIISMVLHSMSDRKFENNINALKLINDGSGK